MMDHLRTLLLLGRVSNLPTVWSNCLAGWWLAGAEHEQKLGWLLAGTALLYVGGMFLNDAFDAAFDREYRRERPIPSGRISLESVWRYGFFFLVAGGLTLLGTGKLTGGVGLLLIFSILLYNAVHKKTAFSPVLMALCRFWVYLAAGSLGNALFSFELVTKAAALSVYVAALSYFARNESSGARHGRWPALLLGTPVLVAFAFAKPSQYEAVGLLSAVLVLWVVRNLRYTLWSAPKEIGRTVAGLLAGIVAVDWLAAAVAPKGFGVIFIALFLCALLFQKVVPAT